MWRLQLFEFTRSSLCGDCSCLSSQVQSVRRLQRCCPERNGIIARERQIGQALYKQRESPRFDVPETTAGQDLSRRQMELLDLVKVGLQMLRFMGTFRGVENYHLCSRLFYVVYDLYSRLLSLSRQREFPRRASLGAQWTCEHRQTSYGAPQRQNTDQPRQVGTQPI